MAQIITSVRNPRILELAKLRRSRQSTDDPVLIDGRREIERAVKAGWRLIELFICPELIDESDRRWLDDKTTPLGERVEVSAAVLERIAYGARRDGLVATAARPRRGLEDLRLTDRPLIAVVHGLEKPGNLGAILRSADAAGVEAIIVSDGRADIYAPAVIRASTGAVFAIPIVEATADAARRWLSEHHVQIVAARPDGSTDYTDFDYTAPTGFVFGAEAQGLGQAWSDSAVRTVRIPMRGVADSLNVSVTAAILFFEARRQRDGGSGS